MAVLLEDLAKVVGAGDGTTHSASGSSSSFGHPGKVRGGSGKDLCPGVVQAADGPGSTTGGCGAFATGNLAVCMEGRRPRRL